MEISIWGYYYKCYIPYTARIYRNLYDGHAFVDICSEVKILIVASIRAEPTHIRSKKSILKELLSLSIYISMKYIIIIVIDMKKTLCEYRIDLFGTSLEY